MAILALLVVLVVPAIGAASTGSLHGSGWMSWWIRDAAGLLLLMPFWSRRPRESADDPPENPEVAEDLLQLSEALMSFESAPKVIVSKTQETPVQRLR